MEEPKTTMDTTKHGINESLEDGVGKGPPVVTVSEEEAEVPEEVQLVPLQGLQFSPVQSPLDDEEDMRDRPLYSPSYNPDDLFAFPFPYVPPLSSEALDKRIKASRAQTQGDNYQRLFRDLVRPNQPAVEIPNVPCGSCPCCQRMLSYVSSLRTVLDHMVSDIVQKSPAGTRVAPCALCLQEHREHEEHVESSQTPAGRTKRPRKPKDVIRNVQRNLEDLRTDGERIPVTVKRTQSEDRDPQKHGGQSSSRPENGSAERRRSWEGPSPDRTTSGDRSEEQFRDADETFKHKGSETHVLYKEPEPLQNARYEDGEQVNKFQNGEQEPVNKSPQRPTVLVKPLTQPDVKSDTEVHQTGNDDTSWMAARAQLLEPPSLSPRDNTSPVVSHGGQYIFQAVDPNRPRNEAYVTMATDNLTALCCLTLGNSLRLAETTRKLAVIVTDGVSGLLRHQLQTVFDVVQNVGVMDSQESTKLALLEQPELGVSFTKLYVWSLDQFTKCVFLESDTLVVQNCDELFEREELSAVPDIGWPDCFNGGVFVFAPSQDTFWKLIHFAEQQDSFDGGDQGLLNMFFQNWACDISRKLPFLYNLMANVSYTYKPAFKHFGTHVKIVHFFGSYKPWNVQFHPRTGQMAPGSNVHPTYAQFVHFWLEIYTKRVLPYFSKDILDHMYSQEYACPHEVLQFVPSPSGRRESLPTPPSFRVYSGDKPRDQPSVIESVLRLASQSETSEEIDYSEEIRRTSDDALSEDTVVESVDLNVLPGSEMDDYQNMAAWEQGHMDYMGNARSDTIMRRLDFLIRGKQ